MLQTVNFDQKPEINIFANKLTSQTSLYDIRLGLCSFLGTALVSRKSFFGPRPKPCIRLIFYLKKGVKNKTHNIEFEHLNLNYKDSRAHVLHSSYSSEKRVLATERFDYCEQFHSKICLRIIRKKQSSRKHK